MLSEINNKRSEDAKKDLPPAEEIFSRRPDHGEAGMPKQRQLMPRGQQLDQLFEHYLSNKKLTGEEIPVRIARLGYQPDCQQIGIEIYERFDIHIDVRRFMASGWFGEEVRRLVSEQLTRNGKTAPPTAAQKREAQIAESRRQRACNTTLEIWLNSLKNSGRKLKLNACGRGADVVWIAKQTGIPYAFLINPKSVCYRTIVTAGTDIGLEHYADSEMILRESTYRQLLEYGSIQRAEAVKYTENADAQLNNTRHGLFKFLKILGISLDSKIGSELGIGFGENLHHAGAAVNEKNTRKKFFHEMRRWEKYYRELLLTDGLPPDFPSALKFLLEISGYSNSAIEKQCKGGRNVNGAMIANWAQGTNNPSIRNLPIIAKLEKIFELPPGTLSARIVFDSKSMIRESLSKGDFPPLSSSQLRWATKHLPPDFPLLPEETQQMLLAVVCEEADRNTSNYRRSQQHLYKQRYRLRQADFPSSLIEEIDQLIHFKTAALPPDGYRRLGRNSRWRKPEPDRRGTVGIFYNVVQTLFGVLVQPSEQGGMGIPLEKLTLTHLVLAGSWKCYLAYIEIRRGEIPFQWVSRYMGLVIPFLDPKNGWIVQSPWLVERLFPVAGFIGEAEVAQAKSDWLDFLRKTNSEIGEIYAQIKLLARDAIPMGDGHQPVLPILESDEPLKLLSDALNAYQNLIPSQHITPFSRALAIRDIVLLRILAETALRQHNIINLTWNKNNTGHLRRLDNGHYEIVIPHTEFKNPHSSFFGPPGRKYPYQVTLSKKLTPLLDEYLLSRRRCLIDHWVAVKKTEPTADDERFLFTSRPNGNNLKISYQGARNLIREFSSTHLVYNPITKTGIKGVEPFSAHAVRHIVATHILKLTGSYAAAAASIQDSESTVRRYYARYLPSDRDKKIRHLITGLMEDEED